MVADPHQARGSRASLPTGTVTFVMTDMEGSTRLLQTLGDAYPMLLDEYYRVLRDAFEPAGGQGLSTEGDGAFYVFREAESAIEGVIEAQRAMATHAWPGDATVRVRIGVHTGAGQRHGDDYVGIDVHRVARISAAAHGGQVLVSDATRALASADRKRAGFRDLGEHRLKDLDAPERLFQLLGDGLADPFPPPRTLGPQRPSLPVELTTFVGREAEKRQLLDLLAANRIVTLTGPGGTGKTRLAMEVASAAAEHYRDGVAFIPLAPVVQDELLLSTIAAAIGVFEGPVRPLRDSVVDHLAGREMLLVLDNFEQLIDVAAVVRDLVENAPGIRVVVTSREPLRIAGEQELPVPPLALPDATEAAPDLIRAVAAVELFVHRARAVRPNFELTNANAADVAAICARLDGLPLAIELAAARLRLFDPAGILAHLDRRLSFLVGGRDVSERQRTLRGAIDWSHDLLDGGERALFRRMAAFAGGATVDAIEAVCQLDEVGSDQLERLASLVDKSLVRRDEAPNGDGRLTMLETIREYAAERLAESGEAEDVRRRHVDWMVALAEDAATGLVSPQGDRWLRRLDRDLDNLRAAIGWCRRVRDAESALRLVASIGLFWVFRNHIREARGYVDEFIGMEDATLTPATRAAALGIAADLAGWQADYAASLPLAEQSVALFRELDDLGNVAAQLTNVGYATTIREPEAARLIFAESLELFRQLGSPPGMGPVLVGISMPELKLGDIAAATAHLTEAAALFRASDNDTMTVIAEGLLGVADRVRGDLASARRRFLDVLDRAGAGGAHVALTLPIAGLADIALLEGDPERGVILEAGAWRLADQLGGVPTFDLMGIAPVLDRAREELSPEVYERAMAQGRAMPIESVLAFARAEPGATP